MRPSDHHVSKHLEFQFDNGINCSQTRKVEVEISRFMTYNIQP